MIVIDVKDVLINVLNVENQYSNAHHVLMVIMKKNRIQLVMLFAKNALVIVRNAIHQLKNALIALISST